MNKLKKLLALAATTALTIVATVAPVSADTYRDTKSGEGNFTVTIEGAKKGHVYKAYQILSGDLNSDGVLSNITWGSGVDGNAVGVNAKDWSKSLSNDNINEKAQDIAQHLKGDGKESGAFDEGSSSYTITGLTAGYYLVKDTTVTGHDAHTLYLMRVVGDTNATPKSDVPSLEKKVIDVNDSTGDKTGWQDSADYDIGDKVPFQLKAVLPRAGVAGGYDSYSTYKLIFHDTASEGITLPSADASNYDVFLNGQKISDEAKVDLFTFAVDGQNLTVTCTNTKDAKLNAAGGSEITVQYKGELNKNAKIGKEGNPNEVYLEFSNNPNNNGGGDTGNTPKDKVIVFTYKVNVDKVDPQGAPLTGADFELQKFDKETGTFKPVDGYKKTINADANKFTFTGLDDGKYKLVETKTPTGYNSVNEMIFEISAEHETTADDPKLLTLNGTDANASGIAFETDLVKGTADTKVVNEKGFTLPKTGDAGTLALYIGGAVVAIGALGTIVYRKKKAQK